MSDLWEHHAGWWQDGFTEGADAEYDEQILPAGRGRHLAEAATRVLDVGLRRGAAGPAGGRASAPARSSASTRPARRSRWPPRRGRRAGLRPRPAPPACRSPTAPSTPSSPAWCSSTSRRSTTPSPRWPGCCGPAVASSSSSTTPCSRRRAAGGSTTRCSTRPSSTGGSAPTWSRTLSIEEVEKDVFIPFIHRPLSRYVNAAGRCRPVRLAHGRAGAARASWPGRGVRGAATIPRLAPLLAVQGRAVSLDRPEFARGHRHVGGGSFDGGRRARGPGLVRDRQPAAGADAQGRRAGHGSRGVDYEPRGPRGRRGPRPSTRSCRRWSQLRGAGASGAHAVPRGADRGAGPPLQGHPPAAPVLDRVAWPTRSRRERRR